MIPIIAVVRFLILRRFLGSVPTFRDFVHRRASSMVMDPTLHSPAADAASAADFSPAGVLCAFLWTASVATLLIAGQVPIGFLITAYAVERVDSVPQRAAHAWARIATRTHGGEVTFLEQLLDSVNYPRHPLLSALWAPVGLRFHALHHLFPSLPYHNLAKAHARLMAELPADSPYRLTESPSLLASLRQLWRTSRGRRRTEPALRVVAEPAAHDRRRART